MNCEQFAERWNAHVAGLLERPDESHMLEHSRACDRCGTKWREHEELSVLLAGVIQPLKPAEDLAARLVDRLPSAPLPRGRQGSTRGDASEPVVMQTGPLLLAAFLGGMAMHVMSGAGGQSSPMEQIALAELMGRGMGMDRFAAVAFSGSELVGLAMALMFLFWITRADFWNALFPIRLPRGMLLARWLAIPTLMIGILQLVLSVWLLISIWSSALFQGRTADMTVVLGTSQFLGQIWTLGFWSTLLLLLLGVLNEITARQVRPLQ
jgi:hypothetical protein